MPIACPRDAGVPPEGFQLKKGPRAWGITNPYSLMSGLCLALLGLLGLWILWRCRPAASPPTHNLSGRWVVVTGRTGYWQGCQLWPAGVCR